MISVLAFICGCRAPDEPVTHAVRTIVGSQYRLPPEKVDLDRSFRDFGRETGLQDEFNYVEVIQRVELQLHVKLPDSRVIVPDKVGREMIPAEATPRWLVQIVREAAARPIAR